MEGSTSKGQHLKSPDDCTPRRLTRRVKRQVAAPGCRSRRRQADNVNRNRSAGRPMMPLTGVELGISVCAHGRAPQLQMCAGPLYGSNDRLGPLPWYLVSTSKKQTYRYSILKRVTVLTRLRNGNTTKDTVFLAKASLTPQVQKGERRKDQGAQSGPPDG